MSALSIGEINDIRGGTSAIKFGSANNANGLYIEANGGLYINGVP